MSNTGAVLMEQTLTDETAMTGKCPATPLVVLHGTRLFCHGRRKPFTLGGGKAQNGHFQARVQRRFCHESCTVIPMYGFHIFWFLNPSIQVLD